MSTKPLSAAATRVYRGAIGYFHGEGYEQEYRVQKEARSSVTKDTMAPEIIGFIMTAIFSVVGICVTLAFNYTLLSLLFIMPLVGVGIGTGYIVYMKKRGY